MKYLTESDYYIDNTGIIAQAHDDVYFSREGGLEETRYVFIERNDLSARFSACDGPFLVAESGFGTGLNFFATVQKWQELAHSSEAHLTFLSFEKFPLPPEAMRAALVSYPELTAYIEQWLPFYPLPIEGVHEIRLGNVTLQLVLGDMQEWLPQLACEADAWFLDGFAPAKNPDMWSDAMMAQVASHTKSGGSLATFTAVGAVRRALKAGGFEMKKVVGFGKKREMLVGVKG